MLNSLKLKQNGKVGKKSEKLGLCFDEIQDVLSEEALNSMKMNNLYGGADIGKRDTVCSRCNDCNICHNCTKCNLLGCTDIQTY
jgi:hypothetical protein